MLGAFCDEVITFPHELCLLHINGFSIRRPKASDLIYSIKILLFGGLKVFNVFWPAIINEICDPSVVAFNVLLVLRVVYILFEESYCAGDY